RVRKTKAESTAGKRECRNTLPPRPIKGSCATSADNSQKIKNGRSKSVEKTKVAIPRGAQMSNLTKKNTPDRSKIDTQNARELRYWTRALSVSKEDLLAAVEKVGNSAATVRKELANANLLKPEDFPLNAEGNEIKKQDGTPVANTNDPALAQDITDRLNSDEDGREENKWSA